MAASPDARGLAPPERQPEPTRPARAGARPPGGRERPAGPVDARVAALASGQHGVVTRAQLQRAGLTRHAIAHRVRAGRLIRLAPGVYAVGHVALGWPGRWLAAVFACGPSAVLSHASAATGQDLLEPRPGLIHVICSSGHPAGPAGVATHRGTFPRGDVVRLGPLPMTAPTRTLVDLAAAGAESDLRAALREAQARRLVRPEDLLARSAGRRGAALMRLLVSDEPGITRSEAERRLRRLLSRAGLPAPRTNVRVGRFEVDALFADERLAIEVDGYAFHGSRAAFERDRDRDAALQARGFRVMRVTWRQLVERPELVVARVAAALAR